MNELIQDHLKKIYQSCCHLNFSTENMLELISQAKRCIAITKTDKNAKPYHKKFVMTFTFQFLKMMEKDITHEQRCHYFSQAKACLVSDILESLDRA